VSEKNGSKGVFGRTNGEVIDADHAVQEDCLTLEEGTARVFRNVGNKLLNPCSVTYRKSSGLNCSAVEA